MASVALHTTDNGRVRLPRHSLSLAPTITHRLTPPSQNQLHRKAACACGGGCPSCQAESNDLNVSKPDDPAEVEADQIADRVMRMSADEVMSDSNVPHSVDRLYRTSDIEGEGEASSDKIQRKVAVVPTTPTVPSDGISPSIQHVMNSGGQPLDRQTCSFFEPRFGWDLSSVRIHTDGTAGESARMIDARAYALGNHIVFGDGEYKPETNAGKSLLAHELAHIVQDRRATKDGGAALAIRRQKKARHDTSAPTGKGFTVELDHGQEGRYRVYFQEWHSRDEVLALLFVDGVLPGGYTLEDDGINFLGWGWKLKVAGGGIGLDTVSQLTPTFQRQLHVGVLALTPDESAEHRRRVEAFKDSRPAFLGGKSVREAFAECPDNASGEMGCWGNRAGVLYYIGFQAGDRGRVLQWRDLPQSPTIVRDIEYWLRQGYSLHDAETKVRQQWAELKVKLILGFIDTLSAVPGVLNRPTLPSSRVQQGGTIVATGAQTYGAWKTALGKDITEVDTLLMGLGGLMGHGSTLHSPKNQVRKVNSLPRLPTAASDDSSHTVASVGSPSLDGDLPASKTVSPAAVPLPTTSPAPHVTTGLPPDVPDVTPVPPVPKQGSYTAHAGGEGEDFSYELRPIVPPEEVTSGRTGIRPDASSPPPVTSPEHLFDRLAQGVDRSLPPPLPIRAIKNPISTGEFQRGLTAADEAYAAYNRALLVSAGREVGICHNSRTGEYRIMVGTEHGVSTPYGNDWIMLLHYHPNPNNVLRFRLPALQDFKQMTMRFVNNKVKVREFIEFNIPGGGRGRTEYGIDPDHAAPFYVQIHQPDGSTPPLRFANETEYLAEWNKRTIALLPGTPEYEEFFRWIPTILREKARRWPLP